MKRIEFNTGWHFKLEKDIDWNCGLGFAKYGEASGGGARFLENNNWEEVTLPHDFALYLPKDRRANTFAGGRPVPYYSRFFLEEHTVLDELYSIGWYRREFDFNPEWKGKRIYITFDGIYRDATIIVNGVFFDRHLSGYVGITLDITDHLFENEKNSIAVRVDATSPEGWWYEGAGIYRGVYLDVAEQIHILPNELFIKSGIDGEVDVSVKLASFSEGDEVETLSLSVLSPSGECVANTVIRSRLSAGDEVTAHARLRVNSPLLWHPNSPTLYTLRIEGTDVCEEKFGFRSFEFDAERGFLLNGEPYKLRGACVHQDFGGVGVALSDNLQYYKIKRLKDMGVNAYRASHHAPSPVILRACDELGMLVMDETRTFGTSPEAKRQLTALVKRDRNHPSVFIWCIGNEEFCVENKEISFRLAEGMKRIIHDLDGTRPITYAGENGPNFVGANRAAEVRGVNYVRNGAAHWLEEYHNEHKEQPIIGTEEASFVVSRADGITDIGSGRLACTGDVTMMWGSTPKGWVKFYEKRPWMSGGFMWTGFDYRGEPNPFYYSNVSSSFGTIDLCGMEKPPFYYYKAWWTDEPTVKIAEPWKYTEGEDVTVTVFTNLDEVELFINERSVGRQRVARFDVARFNVKYEAGRLVAVGAKNGIRYADVKQSWEKAENLTVYTELLPESDTDIGIAEINAFDAEGRLVYDAAERISLEIEGGSIVGVGNGNPQDMYYEVQCDELDYIELCSFNSEDGTYFQPHKTANNLVGRRDFVYREEKAEGFDDDFRIVAAFNTRDLGKEEKTFKTSFVGKYEYVEFERIDSDAEIFLNGKKVGDNFVSYRVTGNHVRPYRFRIQSNDGRNELVIKAQLLGRSKNPFTGYVRVGRRLSPKYEVSLYGGKARVFYRGRNAKISAKFK